VPGRCRFGPKYRRTPAGAQLGGLLLTMPDWAEEVLTARKATARGTREVNSLSDKESVCPADRVGLKREDIPFRTSG
jgi:hypothetical protein